jgi:hypothetical protein
MNVGTSCGRLAGAWKFGKKERMQDLYKLTVIHGLITALSSISTGAIGRIRNLSDVIFYPLG